MNPKESNHEIEVVIDRRRVPRRLRRAGAPIPRITRLMALAIKFQGMIDRGEVKDYACRLRQVEIRLPSGTYASSYGWLIGADSGRRGAG